MGVTWDAPQAEAAVRLMYLRLLGRQPDPGGLQHHVTFLVDKNRTMLEVARGMGQSPEYFQRWVNPSMGPQLWGTPITQYYRHFLNREPESTQVLHRHASVFVKARDDGKADTTFFTAHRHLVSNFTASDEYTTKWGPNGVPGVGFNLPAPKQLSSVKQFLFCVREQTVPPTPAQTLFVWAVSPLQAESTLRASLPNGGIGWEFTHGPC